MSSFEKRLKKRLEDPAFEKEWVASEGLYMETRKQIQKKIKKEAIEERLERIKKETGVGEGQEVKGLSRQDFEWMAAQIEHRYKGE